MEILPIRTPLLRAGDALATVLRSTADIRSSDIVVVSSKAAATCEGGAHDLTHSTPSAEAILLSKKCERSSGFCELVIRETRRLHGTIRGAVPGAILTELQPEGMDGSILIANAGLDESNTAPHTAIGWPLDPVRTVGNLRHALGTPIILTDSCCVPRRLGVLAFALAVSGIDPHRSRKGERDLFGNTLHITVEAVADQLAVAANSVMGNAAESIPAAIIRNHGISLSQFEGWVPGIRREEDLFATLVP